MIKGGKKLLNPLVAAQNFEYKMSNILGVYMSVQRVLATNWASRQTFRK